VRILYVASDQTIPGSTGGSVHVLEVARGLASRGHEVHAIVHRSEGLPAREDRDGVHWYRVSWSPPHRFFRFRARAAAAAIAAEVQPEAVMERYYNFGGEGVLAAADRGLPVLLEVNSPILDHPGSLKGALDALTLVRPLSRYRESLCRQATALVAPILDIVPEAARSKTEIVTWGANVDLFRPSPSRDETRRRLGVPEGAMVVLFSGSFRPWHGVHVFERAARRLERRADIHFLLLGGPAARPGDGFRGGHLGRRPYDELPELLGAGDVGVAPYDTARLGQLRLGFYWSPLKIFEYMASGLATVTIPRFPLTEIVREGEEGFHFREGDADDLARVIERLADEPDFRQRLGLGARARIVERYSWARHCERLEGVLRRMLS